MFWRARRISHVFSKANEKNVIDIDLKKKMERDTTTRPINLDSNNNMILCKGEQKKYLSSTKTIKRTPVLMEENADRKKERKKKENNRTY